MHHMKGYASQPYRNACSIANSLLLRIVNPDTSDKDASLLARVWVEVEGFKRQMRGIPMLAAHSLKELAAARSDMARQINHTPLELFTEIEPSKESISQPAPVTAPPAPQDPMRVAVC